MKIVTVATHVDGYMPWLIQSCERYNTQLYTLGIGEKWEGYNWKFKKMKEFLKTVNPKEVVCFIDAYDVILLKDPKKLEDDFNSFSNISNKKIIIGCDQPKPTYMKALAYVTFGRCEDKLINSGTYIGKAEDLLFMINELQHMAKDDSSVDDQVLLKDWCNVNPNLIHIDCDNIFFLVTGDPYTDLDIKKSISPYFLHAPGNTYIDNIIKDLNYKITPEQEEYIKKYHKRSLVKKVKYYGSFKQYKIIFLLIILYLLYLYLRK